MSTKEKKWPLPRMMLYRFSNLSNVTSRIEVYTKPKKKIFFQNDKKKFQIVFGHSITVLHFYYITNF